MWTTIFNTIIKALPYAALIFVGLIILGIVANIIKYVLMLVGSVCQIIWSFIVLTWYTHTTFIVAAFIAWISIDKVNLTEITREVFITPGFLLCAILGVVATIIKLVITYSDLYVAVWLRCKKEQIEIEKYGLSDIVPEEVKFNYFKNGIIIKS